MRKILLASILLVSASVLCATEKRSYEIWGTDNNEVILLPHVAPMLWVRQAAGPKLPEHGSVNCEFKAEKKTTPKGDVINVLNGYCEGGIVVNLMEIDLNH